jgi:hypothetical protein
MEEPTEIKTTSSPSIEVAGNMPDDDTNQSVPKELTEILEADNVCDLFKEGKDKQKLSDIVKTVTAGISADEQTMKPYIRRYDRAIKRAKLEPENKEKNFPIEKASNVVLPYVLDAALDFNARATPALLERKDICKIAIYGEDRKPVIPQMPPEMMQQLEQQDPEKHQQAMQMMEQMRNAPSPKQARADRVSAMT